MVITEKLHNSLEFVAPGVADRGLPWLTVAVAMPYRSLNDVLEYLFLKGSKPKMSELGYHIQRLNSSEILSTFRDVNQR